MIKRLLASFLLVLSFIFVFIPIKTTRAAKSKDAPTDVVTNLDASGPGSLHDTIDSANSGDTITFQASLFQSGPGKIDGDLTISKNLTIQGPGANLLAIDGGSASVIFIIQAGVTANISGLTIQNGYSTLDGGGIKNNGTLTVVNDNFTSNLAWRSGGAIYNGGTLIVNNCNFSLNTYGTLNGSAGGGIYNAGSALTVTNSTFTGNYASSENPGDDNASGGGAIATYGGTVVINNSTFSENVSGLKAVGGGIYVEGGTVTINGSVFSDNQSTFSGGAIENLGTLVVNSSKFSNNSVSNGGGAGISNGSCATLTVSESTFSNNIASEDGGGIFTGGPGSDCQGSVVINNSLFNGNAAESLAQHTGGGAIYNANQMTVSNSTITDNFAYTRDGNGLFNDYGGNLTINNSTIYNNRPLANNNYNQGIYNLAMMNMGSTIVDRLGNSGNFVSLGSNLLMASSAGPLLTSDQTQFSDPLLNALADNGGGTQSMSLKVGSPAIGMGNCNLGSPAAPVTSDQRGIARKSPACDVGAYETAYDSVVHNSNDRGAGSLRLAVLDAPAETQITFDSAVFSTPQTIFLTSGGLIIDSDLTIIGPGINYAAIDGSNLSPVFTVTGGTVGIAGLTIQHGNNSNNGGGGINNVGTLSLGTVMVINNSAPYGGGIANHGGLTINNSYIANNTATSGSGGGIDNLGTLAVTNTTFANNQGNSGGGLFMEGGTGSIGSSTFSGNTATVAYGGGLYTSRNLTVSNSTFYQNSAERGGGGLYVNSVGKLTVSNSTIANNSSNLMGGGIYNYNGTLNLILYLNRSRLRPGRQID